MYSLFIIESAILTSIYNQANNGKKVCHYKCGEKAVNDANRDANMRVCKCVCDVKWDQYYLKKLQETLNNTKDADLKNATNNKIKFAQKRLMQSQRRLVLAKRALNFRVTKLPADMSYRIAKPAPAFQR